MPSLPLVARVGVAQRRTGGGLSRDNDDLQEAGFSPDSPALIASRSVPPHERGGKVSLQPREFDLGVAFAGDDDGLAAGQGLDAFFFHRRVDRLGVVGVGRVGGGRGGRLALLDRKSTRLNSS